MDHFSSNNDVNKKPIFGAYLSKNDDKQKCWLMHVGREANNPSIMTTKKGEKKSCGLKRGNYIHVIIWHKSVLMVNNVEKFSQ